MKITAQMIIRNHKSGADSLRLSEFGQVDLLIKEIERLRAKQRKAATKGHPAVAQVEKRHLPPAEGRTNHRRATRAQFALTAYKGFENETPGPDLAEDIVDLLADLHHFCRSTSTLARDGDEAKQVLNNLLVSAQSHFDEEMDD